MGSQMVGNDWATEQTTNNLGGLNNRNLFSHTSGGWKSEIGVLAWMTLFLICRQPPSCCVLMWPLLRAYSWKEKVSKPFGVFSKKGCNPHCKDYTLKVSPNNYLPKAPFQMSSLGIVVQLLSCVWLPWTHGLQHARLPFSSTSLRTCSNSCTLSFKFLILFFGVFLIANFSVFSCGSLSFLKTAILYSLSGKSLVSVSLGSATEKTLMLGKTEGRRYYWGCER